MLNDPRALVVPDGKEVVWYSRKDYERVFIPKSVKEIQDRTFEHCESLKEIVFETGSALKKIGSHTFDGCKNLKNI